MTDDTLDVDWVSAAVGLPRGAGVIVRHRSPVEREKLASALVAACRAPGVKVLVSDDPKLALRLRADGVHVPQARIGQAWAARRSGRPMIVTCSAHDRASVSAAGRAGADGVLISPVFPSGSHPERSHVLGVVRLASLVSQSRVPAVALGGIDRRTAGRLAGLRLAGVAAIRGLLR